MTNAELERIKQDVCSLQGEKRFAHTLAVVDEAEYIGTACGFSQAETEKAKLAALLHDITKKFSDEEQAEMFKKYGIDIFSAPPTMHEKTGAYFARERYGKEIVDDEIFSAIFHHTTGGTNMSELDMVIFIADYTEETRKPEICRKTREYLHAECEKLDHDRKKAYALLKEITLSIIGNTLEFLMREKQRIDIRTVEAWNSMI